MKKGFVFIMSIISILGISSCAANKNNIYNQEFGYSLLTPAGAPSLPLYYEILKEENVETTSSPSSIPGEFSLGNYDFLVFDSTTATNLINKEDSLYDFKLMLTGGNFHLLGFNKNANDVPQEDDNIYAFMKGSVSDKLFKNIYGDFIAEDNYFDNVSTLLSVLLSMDNNYSIGGEIVDWALISEPQKTTLLSSLSKNGVDTSKIVDIDLQKAFKESNPTYPYEYIPQAALYVKKSFEKENKEEINSIIERINLSVNNAINDSEGVATTIAQSIGSDNSVQSATFGFNVDTIKEVQKDKKNGFGIVPTTYNQEINDSIVKLFLSIINN